MNIDTDTQWAYWDGLRAYELKHRPSLCRAELPLMNRAAAAADTWIFRGG